MMDLESYFNELYLEDQLYITIIWAMYEDMYMN